MAEKKTIRFDLDRLNNIAHTGVRRAALFMGLGLNAAHREDFNDYQLNKLPIAAGQTNLPMDFFPSDLSNEQIKIFKEQFAQWITACGLRELIEHYALFLDQIHKLGLTVFAVKELLGDINPEQAQTEFNGRFGVPKKLDILKSRFGIDVDDVGFIKSFYEARNCLTHDLGAVLPKRCINDGKFVVSWRALEVFARGDESGIEQSMVNLIGVATKEPNSILCRIVLRERRLSAGEKLIFAQQDLWEICYFFGTHAIPSTLRSFVKFLEGSGVRIENPA